MWTLLLLISISIPGGVELRYVPGPYQGEKQVGTFTTLDACQQVGNDLTRNISAGASYVMFTCKFGRPQ